VPAASRSEIPVLKVLKDVATIPIPMLAVLLPVILLPHLILAVPRPLMPGLVS
jgi:hypothetical protein